MPLISAARCQTDHMLIHKVRRFLAATAIILGVVAVPAVAFAAPDDSVSVPATDPAPFIIIAPGLMTAIAVLIPVLNGMLTKYSLPSGVKAVITIVLNAVAALLLTATQADGTAVISMAAFLTFVYGCIISIASYAGVWKPLNVTSSTPDGKLGPTHGLGPSTP